jgi:hypothetical protein
MVLPNQHRLGASDFALTASGSGLIFHPFSVFSMVKGSPLA